MKGLVAAFGRTIAPFFALSLVIAFFALHAPERPVTIDTVRTILTQTAPVAIAAAGMTWIVIAGGIDLSVGSILALSAVAAAWVMNRGLSWPFGILAALGTGTACGLYNAALVVGLRLPPFIATLGTMGIFRGIAKWLASSATIKPRELGPFPAWMQPFGGAEWLPERVRFAPGVFIMLAVTGASAILLAITVLGRHAKAVGANAEASRLSGISLARTRIAVYAIGGLAAGLGGLLLFGIQNEGDPTAAGGYELQVIAAVVIGGASLSGGQGSALGALSGAILMKWLSNRCTALGWPNWVEEIIVGHIIVLAVAADRWRAARAGPRAGT